MAVDEIKKICVVGAGTMGRQIALQCAAHNYDVHLMDISQEALDKARETITDILENAVKRGQLSSDSMQKALSRVTYFTDLEKAARDADYVIEAVTEDVEVKRQVFSQLDRVCPPHIVLASNTSSIRPSRFADATKRPEKVVATNFDMGTAEVMGHPNTSEETIKIASQMIKNIGLIPIVINGEINGYVFNRIWRAVKREALHLIDKGYASFEDVDRAFMINFGWDMGPFILMDMVGLDVIMDIEEQYYRESGDERDKPPKILVNKVKKGELGVKTGKGFYQYPNPSFKRPGWLGTYTTLIYQEELEEGKELREGT